MGTLTRNGLRYSKPKHYLEKVAFWRNHETQIMRDTINSSKFNTAVLVWKWTKKPYCENAFFFIPKLCSQMIDYFVSGSWWSDHLLGWCISVKDRSQISLQILSEFKQTDELYSTFLPRNYHKIKGLRMISGGIKVNQVV